MAEIQPGGIDPEGREQVDLDSRGGQLIGTTQHMGSAGLDIIDHTGEQVHRRTVRADHDGIGHGGQFHPLLAQHHVGPDDGGVRQPEAPIRPLAVSLGGGALFRSQFQHRAVVDRRLAALDPHFSLEAQLVLILEAGIEPAGSLQPVGGLFVAVQTGRLLDRLVPGQAEPAQIMGDGLHIFRAGALGIEIIQPQGKISLVTAGKKPGNQRHAGTGDMQMAGGRRSEAQPGHASLPSGSAASSGIGSSSLGSSDRQSRSSALARRSAKSPSSVALRQP